MWLSSVYGLYALQTMSGHAPDESADGVLVDLLPGISKLLDSLWQYLVVMDTPIHNIP